MFVYNPHQQDRSGELIAAGIASAGRSLGAGLQQGLEKRDHLKSQEAIGKAFLNAAKQNPQLYGLSPEQVDAMQQQFQDGSLQDRAAFPTVFMQVQQQRDATVQNNLRTAEAQRMQAALDQQQNDSTALGRYFQANQNTTEPATLQTLTGDGLVNNLTGGNPRIWPQSTPELVAGFARSNPGAALRLGLLQQLAKQPQGQDIPIVAQDLGDGRIGYRMPGSRQFEIFSAPEPSAQPVYAEDGKSLLGYNHSNGKGGWTFKPITTQLTVKDKINALQKLQDATLDPTKRAAIGAQVEQLLNDAGGQPPPMVPGGAPAPMVPSGAPAPGAAAPANTNSVTVGNYKVSW
ncbi:MAG: hypothetical protein KGL39_22945 [Patescibacteria group bacterium]|nr:hypothetical protein [Patescibacteria group bacterium]